MKRREFLILAGAGLWPLDLRAESPGKIARIGFLGQAPASAWSGEIDALRQGLRDLGYVEGKNITIEFRWAADPAPASAFSSTQRRRRTPRSCRKCRLQAAPWGSSCR
jgi:hypothetical protein